jgi:hypothetical protein
MGVSLCLQHPNESVLQVTPLPKHVPAGFPLEHRGSCPVLLLYCAKEVVQKIKKKLKIKKKNNKSFFIQINTDDFSSYLQHTN